MSRRRNRAKGWILFQELPPLPEANDHWSTTPIRCWANNIYQVTLYVMPPAPQRGNLPCAQLSIKRHDKKPVTEWRDLQRIKDEILGTMVEAVQLFPLKTRLVDTSNQYHLWALPVSSCFPVGYTDGRVVDTNPETKKLLDEAAEEAKKLPGYTGGYRQAKRAPHHTDEGLPDVGLAGHWWEGHVRVHGAGLRDILDQGELN